jgi:hypothetical protein
MTLVEAYHSKLQRPRWRWALSRLCVEPVTEQIAGDAIDLLQHAGLHGHKYAIDAVLAAVATAPTPHLRRHCPQSQILSSGPRTPTCACVRT